MRIRALLLAAALITTTAASAQKSRDALLVKNEAASRSVIDQPSDDSSITIRDSAGDNLSADHSEIQGIGTASLKKRGYRGFADVGLIVGHVHYDCEQERGAWAGFAATTTHGFMFNRHIFLGAGFGIAHIGGDEFTDYGEFTGPQKVSGATIVPICAAFRAYFRRRRVEPFCELAGGICLMQRLNVSAGALGILGDTGIGDTAPSYEIAAFVAKVAVDFGRLK